MIINIFLWNMLPITLFLSIATISKKYHILCTTASTHVYVRDKGSCAVAFLEYVCKGSLDIKVYLWIVRIVTVYCNIQLVDRDMIEKWKHTMRYFYSKGILWVWKTAQFCRSISFHRYLRVPKSKTIAQFFLEWTLANLLDEVGRQSRRRFLRSESHQK